MEEVKRAYHSTNEKFDKFNVEKISKQPGFWFSTSKNYSSQYGKYIYRAALTLNNVIDLETNKGYEISKKLLNGKEVCDKNVFTKEFRDAMIKNGYDSISWIHHGSRTVVVLHPEQIHIQKIINKNLEKKKGIKM